MGEEQNKRTAETASSPERRNAHCWWERFGHDCMDGYMYDFCVGMFKSYSYESKSVA